MKKKFIIRDDLDRQRFVRWINLFQLGKPIQFTIEHYKKRRSLSQNALYHVWVAEIANDTGNDVDDVHLALKERFLKPEEKNILGEKYLIYTTRSLSTVEFTDFLARVEAFAASDLGIVLSQPEASGWR